MIWEEILLTDWVNGPFPNLILFKFFYFAHILENLSSVCLITHEINFQNFAPLFPVILRIRDLECQGQAPLKINFVKFGDVFMKFRKLKSLHLENKKLDRHKNLVISLHQSFPVLWISDWLHQIEIWEIVQLNSNKHGFQKQPFISVYKTVVLKDTHREKALPNKTPTLSKSTNMGFWVVGTTNQLVKGGSYWNKIFKK